MRSDSDPVVHVEGLVKTFGATRALDGLDLQVRRGEVHGFLGPNGSGKSTTIRILLGLMRSDSGRATLFGRDPWRDAVDLHSRLAYVPGEVTLWPRLTGGQCIDILGRALGGLDPARRAELIDRFRLDPTKRTRDYSKGNRQKVSLVAALASGAELLVLDEPTSGLDPLMEQVFQDCVREAVDGGSTVLLSSHIMGEVEALADRVSIIRDGRTISSGTLGDLRRHTTTEVHAVTDTDPRALEAVDGVDGLRFESAGDGRFDVRCHVPAQRLGEVTGILHAAGIHTLTATPPSLDDLFLSAYSGAGAGEGSTAGPATGPADAGTTAGGPQ
ncbi:MULTISPECIES: ABC transporter ATP-binding protein [unclassified Dietzia]|uniref:ABC transporter ATP-binding protein n=1 Tax=unclassified Dietzia TaxID=2617939 RepID=UPI000D220E83|nr:MULTISPECIES: ABC transporter ATP-binding protein [unclassified Dietzia]AVZ41104.1 ABC transporter ATP-binding protein [Dietzia sp. JS16-p6b]